MSCFLRPIAIVLAACSMAVSPGLAARYDDCVAIIEAVPETAINAARSWMEEDNDPAARHCLALALVRLGRFEEAASELTKLVDASSDAPVHHQVSLLSQAAQGWMLAGAPGHGPIAMINGARSRISTRRSTSRPAVTTPSRSAPRLIVGSNFPISRRTT